MRVVKKLGQVNGCSVDVWRRWVLATPGQGDSRQKHEACVGIKHSLSVFNEY